MQLTNDWCVFPNAIDEKTCKEIISRGEDQWNSAFVKPKKNEAENELEYHISPRQKVDTYQRVSDVVWLEEQSLFDLMWVYMEKANNIITGWEYDIRAAESQQLTRYREGGFFGWHSDGPSDNLSTYDFPENKFLNGHVRKLSGNVVLNDDFEGGDFEFAFLKADNLNSENYGQEDSTMVNGRPAIEMRDGKQYGDGDFKPDLKEPSTNITKPLDEHPTMGTVLIFPSYVNHRVMPVTKGTRYSFVTWFVGPPFK